jgi:3-methyladenine DNA glycosylase Tag
MSDQPRPESDAPYLESATRIMFMGGLNHKVVDNKWARFRERFHDFELADVCELSPADLEEFGQDAQLIRNARKLSATVDNAHVMAELAEAHGSFDAYVEALLREKGIDGAAKALAKQFQFISENGARFWMWSTGHDIGDFGAESRAKYALPPR